MLKKSLIMLIVFAVFCNTMPVFAEESNEAVSAYTMEENQSEKIELTLETAIAMALEKSPRIEAADAQIKSSELSLVVTKDNEKDYKETEKLVCDLKPLDTETNENYTICKCNNVSYFDIIDAVHNHGNIDSLLNVFDDVKNTTKCSTGCGGCYDKVLAIISATMHK